MVMYARKQPRLSDGCHDRRESQPYQTLKYPSKSHPSSGDHRHDKMRDATDPSPPNKMLRRSNSPETKYGDGTGHSKQKTIHAHRVRERDGGTSYSPQENSHNHSVHSSNSHSSNPSSNPSKTSDAPYEPADDWSEHISSSGKKYYYNCRTEVSQWEKPKEWMEREQRQKEASKLAVINSFPKDRDYRREAMQATTTGGFSSGMEEKHASDAGSMLPQNILSQTSRHNDRDYRLPRAETHSCAATVQHPIKPVVHPTAAPSTVPSSPFTLQSDHQPKKSFDANGAATLSKLHTPTSSIPVQKTERKESTSLEKSASHSCSTSSASSSSGLNPAATQSSSTSTVPVSPVPQSPIPPLLQDPNLLRQLLPALQATLQLNNSNVDMSKINEVLTAAVTQASLQSILHKILTAGPSAFNITTLLSQAAQLSTQAQPSNQSPMSLTSDASSPRSYVSPRISTPQTNTVPLKPMISTPPVSSQPKVSNPVVKQGPAPQPVPPVAVDKQHGHDAASPRSLQRSSSQRSPSPGSNHTPSSSASSTAAVPPNTSTRPPCSFTPTLAAHFNENLIKHVQGWPADHAEKQAARLREEAHNMGSIHMSEICTELKNLRSLVRVCEIQATLREQRSLKSKRYTTNM
ncbi:WW domain-containing adapter protein with coiled-coil isoform X2 [Latimeria chalumnae]|uniref:WW domain-containing adapter protein with coiled-coil isoform X2 n=1 Tax=Latimeria chalumnae TaxID=7897 RepID=UPI0006D93DF9|nr:PREDICTED: WW domain-containing adapter protein with coiled-coil isoform X2 [Latimeria chalumnae]|eukprot:XP_014352249.1 PREDICTED: WW domain-containing adapter protein with coiled-coil isoform X2 [Latimeria chalumnae]